MDFGKISVIMGIYNCAETLPEAIESIVEQTYTNWELIMCDDCSTDSTYEIAASYVKKYPNKMKLVKNNKNMHLAYSLNHCLKYARGEYVARMDGDDRSATERFEKQVKYLKEHPEVQLVGTAMQWFDDINGLSNILYKPEKTDKWMLRKIIPFHHATIMTYKYVYDSLGGYTVAERTNRGQDYDLWFRFFAEGFVGNNIQEALYFVREDMNAIKRRTLKARLSVFETTKIGYKMLGYPRTWLVREFCITLFKGLIPAWAQYAFRKIQKQIGVHK